MQVPYWLTPLLWHLSSVWSTSENHEALAWLFHENKHLSSVARFAVTSFGSGYNPKIK